MTHAPIEAVAEHEPTDAHSARPRIGRTLRYLLGTAYLVGFVQSYRTEGFPFDRERVLLWIAAALLINGIGRPWRWSAALVIDLVPFAVLLYAYDYAYVIAKGVGRSVMVQPLVAADRLLFFGHVPSVWLQTRLAHHGPVAWWELGVSIVYASHFVVPLATAGAARWRSRQLFRQWAVRLLTVSFAAVVVFAAMPTGAPWYAANKGLIPSIDRPVGRGWVKIGLRAAPALVEHSRTYFNAYAALPSLHASYSLLFAWFLFTRIGRGRWRWALFAYPGAMAFVLVYGAEHFVIDVVAGWLLVVAAVLVIEHVDVRSIARRCAAAVRRRRRQSVAAIAE